MFLNVSNPATFLLIFVLYNTFVYIKNVGFRCNQTRIVGVTGEHADHLTTTTTANNHLCYKEMQVEFKGLKIRAQSYRCSTLVNYHSRFVQWALQVNFRNANEILGKFCSCFGPELSPRLIDLTVPNLGYPIRLMKY